LKIKGTVGNTSRIKNSIVQDGIRTSDNVENSFQVSLQRAEVCTGQDRIRELIEKIFEQGEKVGKKADIKELNIYKRLVAEFIYEVVNSSSKFSKHSFVDRRGRHKVYAIVKKINTEIELLAQGVLNEEKNNVEILKRIDNIRGLILDIIL
jgi:uncharacterized protein YaaR (DUF327 family)